MPGRVLVGWILGIPLGAWSGDLLPWWISGAPCYVLGFFLLWIKAPRDLAMGAWCGSLAAAATVGMGVQTAWIPALAIFLFLPVVRRVRWLPVQMYCVSLLSAWLAL